MTCSGIDACDLHRHRSSLSALGTGLGRAKSVPPSNALLWGQVSTLGQGFILQRLNHEHSNETTSPRRLQGKTRVE